MLRKLSVVTTPNRSPKPAGGFCFLSVAQLCMAWTCYEQGAIGLAELRAFFACAEMKTRRCGVEKGRSRTAHFSAFELAQLTDQTAAQTRRSLRQLEASGLIHFEPAQLRLSLSPTELPGIYAESCHGMMSQVTNNRRKVPVPRRLIRFLAMNGTRGVIAAAIGHLLRGMYFRSDNCTGEGACKASWIADTFGLDERTVTRGRQELVELGWLEPMKAEQWYLNRYGWRFRINLTWSSQAKVQNVSERNLPARQVSIGSKLPAPIENRNPLTGSKNQKPAPPKDGTGFRIRKGEGGTPSLRHVVRADLDDGSRLLRLFDEARRVGFVTWSEADRLRFFSLAERARRVGRKNACGLFVTLLKRRSWHFASQDDEDVARSRLRRMAPATDQGSNSAIINAASSPEKTRDSLTREEIRRLIEESLAGAPSKFNDADDTDAPIGFLKTTPKPCSSHSFSLPTS